MNRNQLLDLVLVEAAKRWGCSSETLERYVITYSFGEEDGRKFELTAVPLDLYNLEKFYYDARKKARNGRIPEKDLLKQIECKSPEKTLTLYVVDEDVEELRNILRKQAQILRREGYRIFEIPQRYDFIKNGHGISTSRGRKFEMVEVSGYPNSCNLQ